MEQQNVGERVLQVREYFSLTRKQFAERLGITADELRNVESDRLKKPEQKESLYRNIAAEFGVSLDWLKTGESCMFGDNSQDEITMAFGELAARKDLVINGFIDFLHTRTPEQLQFIAAQLRDCVNCIDAFAAKEKED